MKRILVAEGGPLERALVKAQQRLVDARQADASAETIAEAEREVDGEMAAYVAVLEAAHRARDAKKAELRAAAHAVLRRLDE